MKYDYIIIGAGSAGCVLANRLSADASNSVLLVEAGPENKALSLKMPAAVLTNLQSTKHNWAYQGEPEPELNNRQLQHDRGKTLGGSSSINGMLYIRGHALDFEGWRQSGCDGWSYADVLPYFKRMESYGASGDGDNDVYRGNSGPLTIPKTTVQEPLARAFLAAGEQAGYPTTDDISGYCQEGFGTLDSTVHGGERLSTAVAYLDPARHRSNLTIVTDAHVQKVQLDQLNQLNATGIVYKNDKGDTITAIANKDVILSAGAIGTPQLLMLSGIGPASHLSEMGIPILKDLNGVGQNLNEHPDFVLKFACKKPVSLWPKTKPLQKLISGVQWLFTRKGVCASNHFDAVGCIRSAPGVEYPDLQLAISPIAVDDITWAPLQQHAFQIHVGLMQAHSRGDVELNDADPASPPRILVNYLQDPRDRALLRTGIRLIRELIEQPAFASLKGEEIYPGESVQSDEELDQFLSDGIATQWHLSGTAAMGSSSDPLSVVDSSGKVHGVNNLRVVDASVMPTVTNGNTNCPTIMIAEKLSDAILGKTPLKRIEAPFWTNPNYEKAQR